MIGLFYYIFLHLSTDFDIWARFLSHKPPVKKHKNLSRAHKSAWQTEIMVLSCAYQLHSANAFEQKPVHAEIPAESCRVVQDNRESCIEFLLWAVHRTERKLSVGCNGCSRYRTRVCLYLIRLLPWDSGKLRWYRGIIIFSRPLYSWSECGGRFFCRLHTPKLSKIGKDGQAWKITTRKKSKPCPGRKWRSSSLKSWSNR